LVQVEGVGPLVATAMVGAIGSVRQFKNGRELSVWLGLVPREHSSGNCIVLLRISKRGNCYLRTLLIHGGRAAVSVAERDARSIWASRLKLRRGPNVAAVAMASRNPRLIWALLARNESDRLPTYASTAAIVRPRCRRHELEADIERRLEQHQLGKLLTTIEGIGPQTAACIMA